MPAIVVIAGFALLVFTCCLIGFAIASRVDDLARPTSHYGPLLRAARRSAGTVVVRRD